MSIADKRRQDLADLTALSRAVTAREASIREVADRAHEAEPALLQAMDLVDDPAPIAALVGALIALEANEARLNEVVARINNANQEPLL